MKLKHLFLSGLFAGLAGLSVSCSNDLEPVNPDKVLEHESTTYVRISLMGDLSGSRADYSSGSPDESMVKQILLTFFDAGRNYVGRTLVTVGEDDNITVPTTPGPNTVERVLTVVAPVTLPQNINYPKYVIAYVNPTSAFGDLATDKLEDAMRVLRNRAEVSPEGYRTMNNSMYYSNETGYLRFATEVDFETHFFETMEDAQKSDAPTIEITVERMEARVQLENGLSDLSISPYGSTSGLDSESEYELFFVPEAWFVNATERRSFLLKNYRSERVNVPMTSDEYGVTGDFGMSLPTLQDAFKVNNSTPGDRRWESVNDFANLRSYWAIDPTYFTDANSSEDLYPDVSYDVRYQETINPNGKNYPLLYRSYDVAVKEYTSGLGTNYIKFKDGVKSHEYVLENTMSYNTLNGTDAMASMTSVVLLGHYMIKTKAGATVFDGTTTDKSKAFYVRHEADKKNYVMIDDKEAKYFFLERGGSTLFVQQVDNDGVPVENTYIPLRAAHVDPEKGVLYPVSLDDFELFYPDASLTGGKKLSEQWRTMRLVKKNGEYNQNIYIYDATLDHGNGGYRKINDADIDDVNKRLYSTYGVLEKFETGKAYFNVPLRHVWSTGSSSNSFDAKNVILGDYGVVRNHIYSLTINKITGLGTGIGSTEQPIVPPTENEQYYISTRLRILQWRLVSQNVDL